MNVDRSTHVGELAEACEALQQEPLFHLSLHSKELFHSNFLGWFCEAHPTAAAAVFGNWVPSGEEVTSVAVLLEKAHLDLAVELPGLAPFVVENKVFSPPDEGQLDAYAAGPLASLTDPVLLLLSLGASGWATHESPSGHVWRYVSYRQLADALGDAAPIIGEPAEHFDRQIVEHYRHLIHVLDRLAAIAGRVDDNDPLDVPEADATLLRRIRLHDAIGKLRARHGIVAARAHTSPHLVGHTVRWEAKFSNGSPLVSAFLDRGDGDWLGWQYQNGQWRVVVITDQHTGKDAESRARRHAYVRDRYAEWFAFDPVAELTGRSVDKIPPTEGKGAYNGYNPDFVYRYRRLPGLTRNELVDLSHHYLLAAAGWPPLSK